MYHRRDQERLCRLCANTHASKSFKYQSAVLEAKILSNLEWWADIGGNASSKARGWACEAMAAEVDSWWRSRNLRDILVWNLAVIVSSDKATSFTVPKIVIFEDVFLAFKCAPDKYYAKNTDITHKLMIYIFTYHYAIKRSLRILRRNPHFTHIYEITSITQYSQGGYVPPLASTA